MLSQRVVLEQHRFGRLEGEQALSTTHLVPCACSWLESLQSSTGRGLGPCCRAVLVWVGWCFTHSLAQQDRWGHWNWNLWGGVCTRGHEGCSLSSCAAVPGHGGCRKLHVDPQYSDKLLQEKSLTCPVLSPCPAFFYRCIICGGEQPVVINYQQIGVLHFHFP